MQEGQVTAVHELLAHGADPTYTSPDGRNALTMALSGWVSGVRAPIVELLLEHMVEPNLAALESFSDRCGEWQAWYSFL